MGTTHLAEATLAWDFFHGQFTKQSCPLFFRYIEDKAWHHRWMRWAMGNAFGGDHPLPKEIQLLCFCLVGENWIFPLINYENILYVCDCMCVCVHFQSTMLSIYQKVVFYICLMPPKFSKSNEEYQDSPRNNCFLKGSHHQPIRTVHGRAMVQAA